MITVLECATLSWHIYHPEYGLLGKKPENSIIDHRKKITKKYNGWFRVTDVDPLVNPHHPFYAQLYLKFDEGEPTDAVVSYRGTAFAPNWWRPDQYLDNDIVDIHAWYKNVIEGYQAPSNLPEYMNLAIAFWCKARNYVAEYFPVLDSKMLNTTGHSLGGALAALIPVRYLVPAIAVTFNAPGIATMPGVHKDMAGRNIGIEARYDFISKIGEHLGKVEYVDVPNEESKAKEAFALNKDVEKLSSELLHDLPNANTGVEFMEEISQSRKASIDFLFSVMSQHAMAHLLKALALKQNKAVASQMVA